MRCSLGTDARADGCKALGERLQVDQRAQQLHAPRQQAAFQDAAQKLAVRHHHLPHM